MQRLTGYMACGYSQRRACRDATEGSVRLHIVVGVIGNRSDKTQRKMHLEAVRVG